MKEAGVSRWRAVARVLRSPMDALSCALLPASCSFCASPLPQLSPAPICTACWSEFARSSGAACARCGDSLAFERLDPDRRPSGQAKCRACRMVPPPFERAVAYGVYGGRMKQGIHALKYGRMRAMTPGLSEMLAIAIAELAADSPAGLLVVPVPLHWRRSRERGFNQARELAHGAIRLLAGKHPGWDLTLAPTMLMRQVATTSQAGLSPRDRRLNLRGAFAVSDPAQVVGRQVLLVDDIMTTGATARAACKELLAAGAARVFVATLARARRQDTTNDGRAEQDAGIEPVSASIYSSHHEPSF